MGDGVVIGGGGMKQIGNSSDGGGRFSYPSSGETPVLKPRLKGLRDDNEPSVGEPVG